MTKKAFTKLFYGVMTPIYLLFTLISYQKEDIYKEKYIIGIENNYFERIDSVKIEKNTLKTPLFVGEKLFLNEKFNHSTYFLECYTASDLVIKTKFLAKSHKDTILLTLSPNGIISIK